MDATQRWMRDEVRGRAVLSMVEQAFVDDLDDDDELTAIQCFELFDLWIGTEMLTSSPNATRSVHCQYDELQARLVVGARINETAGNRE